MVAKHNISSITLSKTSTNNIISNNNTKVGRLRKCSNGFNVWWQREKYTKLGKGFFFNDNEPIILFIFFKVTRIFKKVITLILKNLSHIQPFICFFFPLK